MPGPTTTPSRRRTRDDARRHLAFRLGNGVGTWEINLSQLNDWPVRSPVNASPTPSRVPAHDSGPMRVATPSSQWTCTTYSLPVSRRTPKIVPKKAG